MAAQAFSLPGQTKPSAPPLISNELFPTVRDLRGGLDGASRRACVTLRMHPNKREKELFACTGIPACWPHSQLPAF